jgi:hypothetical protein
VSIPPGSVRIVSTDPAVVVETVGEVAVRLGDAPPTLSGGSGGWAEVARPKRSSLTEWQGHTARRLSVPVLIDGWRAQASVEQIIARLARLARAEHGAGRPPIVRLQGNVPRSDLRWVIDEIEWGEAVWVGEVRVRQAAALTLLEYDPGRLLVTRATPLGGKPRFGEFGSVAGDRAAEQSADVPVAACGCW